MYQKGDYSAENHFVTFHALVYSGYSGEAVAQTASDALSRLEREYGVHGVSLHPTQLII